MLKPHTMRPPALPPLGCGGGTRKRPAPPRGAARFAGEILARYGGAETAPYPEAWLVLRAAEERQAAQEAGTLRLTQITLRLLLQFNQYLTTDNRPTRTQMDTLTRNLASCLTLLESRDRAAYREVEETLVRLEGLTLTTLPTPEQRRVGREIRRNLKRRIEHLEEQAAALPPPGAEAPPAPAPRAGAAPVPPARIFPPAPWRGRPRPVPAGETPSARRRRGEGPEAPGAPPAYLPQAPFASRPGVPSAYTPPEGYGDRMRVLTLNSVLYRLLPEGRWAQPPAGPGTEAFGRRQPSREVPPERAGGTGGAVPRPPVLTPPQAPAAAERNAASPFLREETAGREADPALRRPRPWPETERPAGDGGAPGSQDTRPFPGPAHGPEPGGRAVPMGGPRPLWALTRDGTPPAAPFARPGDTGAVITLRRFLRRTQSAAPEGAAQARPAPPPPAAVRGEAPTGPARRPPEGAAGSLRAAAGLARALSAARAQAASSLSAGTPGRPAGQPAAEGGLSGAPAGRRALSWGRELRARGADPAWRAPSPGRSAAELALTLHKERLIRSLQSVEEHRDERIWRRVEETAAQVLLRSEAWHTQALTRREMLFRAIRTSTVDEYTALLRALSPQDAAPGRPVPAPGETQAAPAGQEEGDCLLHTLEQAGPALGRLRLLLGGGRLQRQTLLRALEEEPPAARIALLALAEESGVFSGGARAAREAGEAPRPPEERLTLLVRESRRKQLEKLIHWTDEQLSLRTAEASPARGGDAVPPPPPGAAPPAALLRLLEEGPRPVLRMVERAVERAGPRARRALLAALAGAEEPAAPPPPTPVRPEGWREIEALVRLAGERGRLAVVLETLREAGGPGEGAAPRRQAPAPPALAVTPRISLTHLRPRPQYQGPGYGSGTAGTALIPGPAGAAARPGPETGAPPAQAGARRGPLRLYLPAGDRDAARTPASARQAGGVLKAAAAAAAMTGAAGPGPGTPGSAAASGPAVPGAPVPGTRWTLLRLLRRTEYQSTQNLLRPLERTEYQFYQRLLRLRRETGAEGADAPGTVRAPGPGPAPGMKPPPRETGPLPGPVLRLLREPVGTVGSEYSPPGTAPAGREPSGAPWTGPSAGGYALRLWGSPPGGGIRPPRPPARAGRLTLPRPRRAPPAPAPMALLNLASAPGPALRRGGAAPRPPAQPEGWEAPALALRRGEAGREQTLQAARRAAAEAVDLRVERTAPELHLLRSQGREQRTVMEEQRARLNGLQEQVAGQEKLLRQALDTRRPILGEGPEEVRRMARAVLKEMEGQLRLERQRRGL